MSTQLPDNYLQWVKACNQTANSQQYLVGMPPPLLPSTNPEKFWVLYRGSYLLCHWSEIPALFAPPVAEPTPEQVAEQAAEPTDAAE